MNDLDRLALDAARSLPIRLHEVLLPLRSTLSLLQTGAHPDDETTGLLALLRYGFGLQVGFACSTRGEGGQNGLSGARGADLGALRTREMEEAAVSLGLVLHWLTPGGGDPVVDFRFSRSAEETLGRWGSERLLERLVRLLRRERPDMVCPTFLDVPGQHGHHRAMTRLAREAYERAADPRAFPQHAEAGLGPWEVAKFYLPAWSGAGDSYDDTEPPPPATTPHDIGAVDPVMGVAYARIGEWSRRFHRTQGMGRWPAGGPILRPLHLAASRVGPTGHEAAVTDGLPATLADLDGGPGLGTAQAAIDEARSMPAGTPGQARLLAEALQAVRSAREGLADSLRTRIGHRLARKESELARAVLVASGVHAFVDAPERVVEGETWTLGLHLDGPGEVQRFELVQGWRQEPSSPGGPLVRGCVAPAPDDVERFDPLEPETRPRVRIALRVGAVEAQASFAASRPTWVVPALTLSPELDAVVANRTLGPRTAELLVRIEGKAAPDRITLEQVAGVNATTRPAGAGSAHELVLALELDPTRMPPRAAAAVLHEDRPAQAIWHETHAHLGRVQRLRPARLRLASMEVRIAPGTRVAYIGAGHDQVDRWLRQVGVAIDSVAQGGLGAVELGQYSTVLVGIFGFGMRPDLAAATASLHRFVREGGNLVTLYHRPSDGWDPAATPLAPIEIGRPSLRFRVTDAAAPVRVLDASHPLLAGPNRIGHEDWAGWQRERGLYFAKAWDSAYQALVELSDPGEPKLEGALLSGVFGQGRHTHVALSLHTELDALTEGAFRLMANLVQPAATLR